jgi:hypothetical protein
VRRSWWAWTTLVAVLLPPATATALDDGPKVAISGTPRVGAVLDAVARFDDDDYATATYAWQACTGKAASSCTAIAGATASRYVPTDLDIGQRIQVRLTVREDDDDDDDAKVVSSALTAPVAAAPAAPGGSNSPPPGPAAPPPAASSGALPPAGATTPSLAGSSPPRSVRGPPRRPRRMHPAPIVRIAGFVTQTGATITRLSVRAPRGATIAVRCTGPGCPQRKLVRATAETRLGEFERHLRAGVRLEIRVTRRNYVGKYTLIRVRRGKPPVRIDRCLYPGSSAPRRC